MKKRYLPVWLLPLKAKANLGVIVAIGGGLIILGWIGAKVISKLIDLQDQEEQRQQDQQDQAKVTGEIPSVTGQVLAAEPVFALAAAEPQWILGPEREHNQNHNLQIEILDGNIVVLVPTYTCLDWSFDGITWYPWTTNIGPDRVELFEASGDMMFFKGRGIGKPILK